MQSRDPHQALKTEIVKQATSQRGGFTLARLQWSKSEIGHSLHVTPNSFSTAGLQTPDFLNYLGFRHSRCGFATGGQCYVRWVDESFDVEAFAKSFEDAFGRLVEAERHLSGCGFPLDQPEGWAFFTGKGARSRRPDWSMSGDGHTASSTREMKQSEDAVFHYRFTFIDSGRSKGFVIHIRPKHTPLSAEMETVLRFLKLDTIESCPQFDFDPCYWKSYAYIEREDDFFGRNTEIVHGWFDALAGHFSPGLEQLLRANGEVEKFGMSFLPISPRSERLKADIRKRVQKAGAPETKSVRHISARTRESPDGRFDVAISFAGTEREHAAQLADLIKAAGFSVFYDDFYPEFLWGKNLVDTFDEIYRRGARFCVMFVSKEYVERMWTNHERKSAQARALQEQGNEYILPIKVDDTDLTGMPPTIGYVPLSAGIERIADVLINKLKA